MFLSIVNNAFDSQVPQIVAAHWRAVGDPDHRHPAGVAAVGDTTGDIGFLVTADVVTGPGVLACHAVDVPGQNWALRVDEVAFPVGAIAYRHTHSGSGWRQLVSGALRVEADHETRTMSPGDRWFEPANAPVRAVAMQKTGVTRFVRCMIIPCADIDRSTFKLCRAKDAQLPRLQVTHRHFDHIPQLDAG